MKTHRRLTRPAIGDLVLASRFQDRCPLDPWAIGFVCELLTISEIKQGFYNVALRLPMMLSARSVYRLAHAWRITAPESHHILRKYRHWEKLQINRAPTWAQMDKCDMCGEPWDNSTRGHVCL